MVFDVHMDVTFVPSVGQMVAAVEHTDFLAGTGIQTDCLGAARANQVLTCRWIVPVRHAHGTCREWVLTGRWV